MYSSFINWGRFSLCHMSIRVVLHLCVSFKFCSRKMSQTLELCLFGVAVVHTCITVLVANRLPLWIVLFSLFVATTELAAALVVHELNDHWGEEDNDRLHRSFDSGIGLDPDFESLEA